MDVAYRLRRDDWQGVERFQLELEAIRCSGGDTVVLQRRDRTYWCRRQGDSLVVRNAAGVELHSSTSPEHPYLRALLQDAALALGLAA